MMNPGMIGNPNPMAMFGFNRIPTMQKFDFPMEVQVYFKNKNIGHVRTDPQKRCRKYDSIFFNRPDIIQKFEFGPAPPREKTETKAEKKHRIKREKRREHKKMVKQLYQEWNPFENENKEENLQNYSKDPYKTLFIGHLSYKVTEERLAKEFEHFGPIKLLKIVRDHKGKSRGYAFIEFENTKDFNKAYKKTDGKRIEDKRILVDIERARTMLNFKPQRLGGTRNLDESRSKDRKKMKKKDKKEEPLKSRSRSRDKEKKEKKDKKKKDKKQNGDGDALMQKEEEQNDNWIEQLEKKDKKSKKKDDKEKKSKKPKDKEKIYKVAGEVVQPWEVPKETPNIVEDGEFQDEKKKKHKKEKDKKK